MIDCVHPRFVPMPYQDSAECGRLLLRDGSTAHLRPAAADDREELSSFLSLLTNEHRKNVLLGGIGSPVSRTLVVTRIQKGLSHIVAAGAYSSREDRTAEIVVEVAEELKGKGLGTLLLERLMLLAAHQGYSRLITRTAPENHSTLELLRASGFTIAEHASGHDVEIILSAIPTDATVSRLEARDRVATIASLVPFFRPNAVAIVGASRVPSAVGRRILDAMQEAGFAKPIYPVNPHAEEINGLRAYSSARMLPEAVDLAVIAVPAAAVSTVIDDCAARGVKAVVVITAGFAEIGPTGIALQRALLEKVRGYGMRMVGPNCLGILNASPTVRLNASFSPVTPRPGRIGMSSQSGAVGLAVLTAAQRFGLGFSTFVSVGNKADVSANDLLQYWEDDPETDVILLYMESFGNPRRFARIARRVGQRKPVVVLHSGLSRAGGRAAGSHTAALATNATAVQALFRQSGVIRAATLEEMFDLAVMLGRQPLPRGNRVGIITNAGGPAILCTDACEAAGIVVPLPSEDLRAKLAGIAPHAASLGNPVDLIAAAGPTEFRGSVEAMLASGEYDSLIVMFTPVGLARTEDILQAIAVGTATARAAGVTDRPVLAAIVGGSERPEHITGAGEQIPVYPYPESPAQVLGKAVSYAAWRAQPHEVFPDFQDLDLTAARAICQQSLAKSGSGWLPVTEAWSLLRSIGLHLVPGEVASTRQQAVEAASRLGFPVALKLASHTLVHKTEVEGVHLNLADADAVRLAYEAIAERLTLLGKRDEMDGVVVQSMQSGGVEIMAGITQDPLFGPLVAVGLGGIHVEILADVAFRVTPLSDRDATEMVRSLRGYRLLQGYRGHPPADIPAVEEMLLRVSRLAEEIPEIVEIDLNPLFALPPGQGCLVADCRIRVKS